MKNIIIQIILSLSFFLFIPLGIYAADLNITCYPDRYPEIIRNVDPLFQLRGFLPGSYASRTIYVENTDTVNPCRIFFITRGSRNELTDKIEVEVSGGLFNGSLTQYIDGSEIMMANLSSGLNITRTISMELPTDAGNTYQSRNASFDIIVRSEWGDSASTDDTPPQIPTTPEDGDTVGVTDTTPRPPFVRRISDKLGIGGLDDQVDSDEEEDIEEKEILGEEDNGICDERTLWWIPIVIQLILTIAIAVVDKSVLEKKHIKLLISFAFGIISFFVVRAIGCACELPWLCVNHWILNTSVAILPLFRYIERKKPEYLEDYKQEDML
jgi:hypothetical protein